MGETWTTKDGTEIPISELGDDHLRNIVRMLTRKGFVSRSTLKAYLVDGPSADMASVAFEEEQARVFDAPVSSHLDALEAEMDNRGLCV